MHRSHQLLSDALFRDNNIEYHENGEWISICCPFCGDHKFHLGYSRERGNWNCFKCGTHRTYETVAALLNISIHQAADVCKQYGTPTRTRIPTDDALQANVGRVSAVKLPYGTGPMASRHRDYLQSRGFDPERLETEWGLLGTGPVGSFSHRIIIPIEQGGKLVCFQGRDITGKSNKRYKSCPDTLAVIPIKNCVYNIDLATQNSVVITEGVTKVWRLRKNAVATFGANVTDQQMLLLKQFRRTFILFDEDEAGEKGAHILAQRLSVLGVHPEIVTTGIKDTAELSDADATQLMGEFK